MPAESIKQRRLFALAEHHPEEVYAQDAGVLTMSHSQLHDYAATPETDLPKVKSPGDDMGTRHFIAKAIKHPGALHRDLDIPSDRKIPIVKAEKAEHSRSPKVRKRASFFLNVLRQASH